MTDTEQTNTNPSSPEWGDEMLSKNPLSIFEEWFNEVQAKAPLNEPSAMALATVSPEGEIHNRIVLLKKIVPEGLIFFTNYNSAKGKDLAAHPQAEAVFYWDHWLRQVRIGGAIEKTSREISEDYWRARPRDSQIHQWASSQSSPLKNRSELLEQVNKAKENFKDKEVPCPFHWGGYLLKPNRVELWIGVENRLHHRFAYHRKEKDWTSSRLNP